MSLAVNIFAKLSTDAAVSAVLGGGSSCKLYPVNAPSGATAPYCVFSTTSTEPTPTHDDAGGVELVDVQFSCVGSTPAVARSIAVAIRNALESGPLASGEVTAECNRYDGFSEATQTFLVFLHASIWAQADE